MDFYERDAESSDHLSAIPSLDETIVVYVKYTPYCKKRYIDTIRGNESCLRQKKNSGLKFLVK